MLKLARMCTKGHDCFACDTYGSKCQRLFSEYILRQLDKGKQHKDEGSIYDMLLKWSKQESIKEPKRQKTT